MTTSSVMPKTILASAPKVLNSSPVKTSPEDKKDMETLLTAVKDLNLNMRSKSHTVSNEDEIATSVAKIIKTAQNTKSDLVRVKSLEILEASQIVIVDRRTNSGKAILMGLTPFVFRVTELHFFLNFLNDQIKRTKFTLLNQNPAQTPKELKQLDKLISLEANALKFLVSKSQIMQNMGNIQSMLHELEDSANTAIKEKDRKIVTVILDILYDFSKILKERRTGVLKTVFAAPTIYYPIKWYHNKQNIDRLSEEVNIIQKRIKDAYQNS